MAMRLKPSASKPPKLYGLPKIHKPQVPVRLIVSCINSPTYQLAKYVNTLISPLVGQTPSFVKNTHNFVEFVRSICLQPTKAMVSFDIKSFFANVPTQEALEVIEEN